VSRLLIPLWIALQWSASALPVPLLNPSGEANNGIDRSAIPHPAFPGWEGANGQSIRGGTHGGNGAWRISISPGGEVRQRSGRLIQAGAAFSLRFDAAPFSGLPPVVTAEFYTEPAPGTVNVLLSKAFNFTTPLASGSWEAFQLLGDFGGFDAAAGQAIGVRFRNPAGAGIFLSIDNIRLEVFEAPAAATSFSADWSATPDRPWAGPDFWANRLQDWEVRGGRLQTRLIPTPRPIRTVHRLTTAVREEPGNFSLTARAGLASATWNTGALCGIFIGAGASHDHRGAALMHHRGGRDGGIFLGVNSLGRAVIHDNRLAAFTQVALGNTPAAVPASCRIVASATWQPATRDYLLAVQVRDGGTDALASTASVTVEPYAVLGNFGLFSHPASGDARFWFDDFSGSGSKLVNLSERAFGPVVATQYTLSRGVLKLTAQLAPVAAAGAPPVSLETDTGNGWQTVATATIDPDSYTAGFRVPGWNHGVPVPFRIGFGENGTTRYRGGTIQADPVDQAEIVVAGLTCMIHCAADSANDGFNGIDEAAGGAVSWTRDRINFPHENVTRSLALQRPDLYAFTGDQVYEGGSPTTQDSSSDENRRLDYLYKWFLHCWTWRDLIADRPSLTIPDDHDVYQGNLWGEGGKAVATQEAGGYTKPAAFVRMVERTQTSHLPDPFDPTPVLQDIGVYYTSWIYGRIGFAILEDRKFKNGYSDEGFGAINTASAGDDTARFNRTNLHLLGTRQEAFLEAFAADWAGHDMKAVISQSPFASSSTHSGPGYVRRYYDLDANGWPQNKRDKAVGLLRKSFAPHINGDQHLAVLLQHGIAGQRDAVYSFCVPAVANAFARAWNPASSAGGINPTVSPYTGPYLDGFGNRIHILAAANPAHYHGRTTHQGTPLLHDRGPGYGIIRFNKPDRTTTFECWPLHAAPGQGTQYPGWPLTIRQTDNDGRLPAAWLPVIDTGTTTDPVVRVHDEVSGELVYGYRVNGNRFRPPVFLAGRSYRVEVVAADGLAPQVTPGVAAAAMPAHAIARFDGASRYLIRGRSLRLRWDCPSAATISISPGPGDLTGRSLHGIGHLDTVPLADTTWTLTSTPSSGPALQAQASVRVFPTFEEWRGASFLAADLADPAKEATLWGDEADPDRDGLSNRAEYAVQTDPLAGQSTDVMRSGLSELVVSSSTGTYPVHTLRELLPGAGWEYEAQWSDRLGTWQRVPWDQLVEVDRVTGGPGQTDRVTLRMPDSIATAAAVAPERFYRVLLKPLVP
jgi:hypothetical protein